MQEANEGEMIRAVLNREIKDEDSRLKMLNTAAMDKIINKIVGYISQ